MKARLIVVASALLRVVPGALASRVAGAIGSACWLLLRSRRLTVLENLRHTAPNASTHERRRLAHATFRQFALCTLDLLRAPHLTPQDLESMVERGELWHGQALVVQRGEHHVAGERGLVGHQRDRLRRMIGARIVGRRGARTARWRIAAGVVIGRAAVTGRVAGAAALRRAHPRVARALDAAAGRCGAVVVGVAGRGRRRDHTRDLALAARVERARGEARHQPEMQLPPAHAGGRIPRAARSLSEDPAGPGRGSDTSDSRRGPRWLRRPDGGCRPPP